METRPTDLSDLLPAAPSTGAVGLSASIAEPPQHLVGVLDDPLLGAAPGAELHLPNPHRPVGVDRCLAPLAGGVGVRLQVGQCHAGRDADSHRCVNTHQKPPPCRGVTSQYTTSAAA